MEQCQAYRPWHNKQTHKTYVKMTQGKCLHYYFYFIDPRFRLMLLAGTDLVSLSVYKFLASHGHNALATQLQSEQIVFEQIDNSLSAYCRLCPGQRISSIL